MVEGIVTEDWAAVFPLLLLGLNGQEVSIEVTLDTGFDDYLTLPLSVITSLDFPYISPARGVLADGSSVDSGYYGATILWNGAPRRLPVIASDNTPLGGMLLVRGCEVAFIAEPGQRLFIRPAPPNNQESTMKP